MDFLIDAHLSPSLGAFLNSLGHNTIHTSQLPSGNGTSDKEINRISMNEKRVLITKDSDFFHSAILKKQPYKLVMVKIGNIRASEMQTIFSTHLDTILKALSQVSIVELSRDDVKQLL